MNKPSRQPSAATSLTSPSTRPAHSAPNAAAAIGGAGIARCARRKLRTTPEASAVNADQPSEATSSAATPPPCAVDHRPIAVTAAIAHSASARSHPGKLPPVATVAVAPSASSHSATNAKPLATLGAKAIAKLPMPTQPATSSAHAQARAAVSRSDGVLTGVSAFMRSSRAPTWPATAACGRWWR